MPSPRVMASSRTIPVEVDTAFRATLSISLPVIFSRWYGPIAPVKAVHDQVGEWGTVGQTRTVAQVGGGRLREELTRVEPPGVFAYRLSDITGPLAPLVAQVDGEWRFEPADAGTTVTWKWTVHPKSRMAAGAMPAFEFLWRGYARQGLQQLAAELVR